MNHQFYLQAPELGPVYTVQYFNLDDSNKDKTYTTANVMGKIQEITHGEAFYYQFDNGNNVSHCVTARFNGDTLEIESVEIMTTKPDSHYLTEIVTPRPALADDPADSNPANFPMVPGEGGPQFTFYIPEQPTQLSLI